VIEAHHAVNLGARQVQRIGDHRNSFGVDVAECRLKRVQNRQPGALARAFAGNDVGPALTGPWLEPGHSGPSWIGSQSALDEALGG
jgi:hypothetical protein